MSGAIFGHRDPAGVERPDGSLVITDGVVEADAIAQDAGAPVGRKFGGSPAAHHGLTLIERVGPVPPGNGGKNSRSVVGCTVAVPAEGVEIGLGAEVFFLDQRTDTCCAGVGGAGESGV